MFHQTFDFMYIFRVGNLEKTSRDISYIIATQVCHFQGKKCGGRNNSLTNNLNNPISSMKLTA